MTYNGNTSFDGSYIGFYTYTNGSQSVTCAYQYDPGTPPDGPSLAPEQL